MQSLGLKNYQLSDLRVGMKVEFYTPRGSKPKDTGIITKVRKDSPSWGQLCVKCDKYRHNIGGDSSEIFRSPSDITSIINDAEEVPDYIHDLLEELALC